MSCQYIYKSGSRKNQECGLRSYSNKYCKKHQRVIKALETKRKNKLKNKSTKIKPPTSKISKTPPIYNSKKKSSNNISVGTSDFSNNLTNLFNLFDIPILPLQRQQAIPALEEEEEKKEDIEQPTEIKFDVDYTDLKNINGLLKIIKTYRQRPIVEESTINYDLEKLCRIEQDLTELNSMIGLTKIKAKLCDMVVYLCQKRKIEKTSNTTSDLHNDYLHTVLQGPPGCGKTSLARILANIYKKLGLLSKGNIVYAKRSDLVGKYCGHTAYLTQSKIDEAKGGVLFIDEAYSLGNKDDNPDAFSRECIDTLNQNLSERNDFVCIIAGYKKELDKRFFSVNPGLSRRFPWVFNIDKYSASELQQMFFSKSKEMGFNVEKDALPLNFFNTNKENFPYFGGSIHTFLNKIKICNYKRLFGHLEKTNTITKEDVLNAFEMYKLLEMGNKKFEESRPPMGMYL